MDNKSFPGAAAYAAESNDTIARSSALQEVPADLLREVAGALLEANEA